MGNAKPKVSHEGRDVPWNIRRLSANYDGCTSVHPYVSRYYAILGSKNR